MSLARCVDLGKQKPRRDGGVFKLKDVWLQLAKNVEDIFVIGLLVQRVHLSEGDLSLLIDHEYSALVDTGNGISLAEDAELLRGISVRVEIAAQRVIECPDVFLLPRNMAGY
jgi:hypothetical protein